MRELDSVLHIVAFAYMSAGVGLLSALLARSYSRRNGRLPSAADASWCATLPPLALLLWPLAATDPHLTGSLGSFHEIWHAWERTLHAAPLSHGLLHVANVLLLLLAATGVVRAVYAMARMCSFASRVHRACRASGRPSDGALTIQGVPLYTLASNRPLCFTMGFLRPAIYLSTGLRERLSPYECDAMLAHEVAHVRRHDCRTRALLALFYTLFPLPGSRLLLADWSHASERECDAFAARHTGSGVDVAAALIRTAQIASPPSARGADGVCFAAFGDDIEGRVEALLAPPTSRSRGRPTRLVLVGMGCILTGSLWISHAVDLFVRH